MKNWNTPILSARDVISILVGSALLALLLTLCSCTPKVDVPDFQVPGVVIVTDTLGQKYRLVEREKSLGNNLTQAELWEKIEPLDTNRWYTPSLGSKMDTNNPPIFNSLSR